MGNIQTAGPNEALIVSGGCCRPSRKQIIVGGWCWNTWMLTNIQRISLQIMTLNPKCEHVQSVQGVPVTVTGVVHCKIMSAPEFLPLAAEQFLGKSTDHIKSVILHTVEGHMRAVIGTQPIEEICQKRQTLASLIRSAAIDDLSRMGIDILSLTIREIKDDVEYLNSAGKKATATAKMKASVSTAKADSDASKREAELQKQRKEEEIAVEKDLAELKHNLDKAKHETDEIVGRSTADATKAYDLQLALLQKDIRVTEMEVKSHELENLVKVQQKENERHKTELEIEIKLPCDAEIYELKKQTEAFEKKNAIETAAEEFRIITEGQARANATKLEGNAEADGMRKVAEARKEFNEAAVLFEVLKVLPDIAAEIASPLNKFEEIVLISDGATQNNNKSSHDQHKSADTKGNILRSATSGLAAEASKLSSAVPMAVRAVGGSERLSSNIVNSILQLQKSAG